MASQIFLGFTLSVSEWQKWAFSFFSSGVVAVIAAFLSAKWATSKTLKEKWWARKESAYVDIIEAIVDRMNYYDQLETYSFRRSEDDPPEELVVKSREARWKLYKISEVGPFVISEKAASALRDLLCGEPSSNDYEFAEDYYGEMLGYYRAALDFLRGCALEDLGVKRWKRGPLAMME